MTRLSLVVVAGLALGLLLMDAPAHAGCGCDHPPPAWAPVMPAFGAPGRAIRIHSPADDFTVGASYKVAFEKAGSVTVKATSGSALHLTVPDGIAPGPVEIKITGPGLKHTYGGHHFTALPVARRLPANGGAFEHAKFPAAVTTDGTLLIPVDLSEVLDPMQLAFQVRGVPLRFEIDDIVFYNADGVDLTLFTLAVDGQTEMQWGSYYGWEVEEDTGLVADVFEKKVKKSPKPGKDSDTLTYWRHEFHTYAKAHADGGSHELGASGLHADGTEHIDHDNVVLAISVVKRDPKKPEDSSKWKPLKPGKRNVRLTVLAAPAEGPVEPNEVVEVLENTTSFLAFPE